MQSDQNRAKVLRGVAAGTPYTAMDVFGPTVEFVSGRDDPGADFCVMRGVLVGRMTLSACGHTHANWTHNQRARRHRLFAEHGKRNLGQPLVK